MSAIEDRERAVLIDLSRAVSSADAVKQLEEYLEQSNLLFGPGALIDINTGDLLLTSGVLTKMKTVIHRFGVNIETLYSNVPQTQQSALDEGLLVRRTPSTHKARQSFVPGKLPIPPEGSGVELPFEKNTAHATPPEPLSRLSVTLEDGTREEVRSLGETAQDTVYYRQNLRSGQVLEAKGNIVVVGDAHSGSEILADGDILVWGFLGGVAHAGRKGNTSAEIRAIRIEAVQLRIGDSIARRPDRLFMQQQIKKRGPEVARIQDGEIKIFEDIVER